MDTGCPRLGPGLLVLLPPRTQCFCSHQAWGSLGFNPRLGTQPRGWAGVREAIGAPWASGTDGETGASAAPSWQVASLQAP